MVRLAAEAEGRAAWELEPRHVRHVAQCRAPAAPAARPCASPSAPPKHPLARALPAVLPPPRMFMLGLPVTAGAFLFPAILYLKFSK